MDKITIGVVGAGRATELHMYGYRHAELPIRLKTLVGGQDKEKARKAQESYGFENLSFDFEDLLRDEEIDVIDINTPPYIHTKMIIQALKAGKHVICEKPLTGYFGIEGDPEPIGKKVSRSKMYEHLLKELDELEEVVNHSDCKFMYAENWIYAPAIIKAGEIVRAKKSRILHMEGEESLKGSSSPVAGEWSKTGGGSFVRNGVHPLGAILWLKGQEAKSHGIEIGIKSVIGDMGYAVGSLNEYEHRHIAAHPHDVEDNGIVTITFTDGTKALIVSTDNLLGGTRTFVNLYCNDSAINCKLTLSDAMETYMLDEDGMEQVYLSEMLPSSLGWNRPFVADENMRGYISEINDFLAAIYYDREPIAGFEVAKNVIKVTYAAYLSAETGKRVEF